VYTVIGARMMGLQELLKMICFAWRHMLVCFMFVNTAVSVTRGTVTIFLVLFIVKVFNNATFVFRDVRQIVKSDY